MRRTLAAILARELNPHLKPFNALVPTPTIVPVTSTTTVCTSPVASILTAKSMPVTPTSQPLINATTLSESRIARSLMSPIAMMSPIADFNVTQLSFSSNKCRFTSVYTQRAIYQPSDVFNENGIPIGRDITIDTSGQQFMSLPDLTKLYNKSCSWHNMAANLVRALFDEETRKQCYVSGMRDKDMLDPVVVSFIKNMCSKFFR